jgi:hypothetical protein
MTSNSYQIQISNTLAPTVTPLMLAISSENSSNSSVGQSGPTGSVGQSGPIGPIGPIGPTGPPLSMLITSVYNTSGSPPEIRVNQIYIYFDRQSANPIPPYTTIKITNTDDSNSPFNNQIFTVAAYPTPQTYAFFTTSTNGLNSSQFITGCNSFTVNIITYQQLILQYLPTSSAGLPLGSVWRNGNVLNIV